MQAERAPEPVQLTLTIPTGASVTVTNEQQAGLQPPRILHRITPIVIDKFYPHEPVVDPSLVEKLVQSFKDFGDDHTETINLMNQFENAVDVVFRRGFTYRRFERDLESIFADMRPGNEGHKQGIEQERMIEFRDSLLLIGMERLPSDEEQKPTKTA